MRYSIIIADDEPNACTRLKTLIEKDEELELLGTFNNGLEVLKFCKSMSPDIILLDIQMPGCDGLSTAKKLLENDIKSNIAFITAYDEFAIEAFQVEAVGYLLKPFAEEDFYKVLRSLKSKSKDQIKDVYREKFERLWQRVSSERSPFLKEFHIKQKGLINKVSIEKVECIVANGDYLKIRSNGREYLYRATMEIISKQLPNEFLRIHRSVIINTNYITNQKYLNNGTFEFILLSGIIWRSSRKYLEDIRSQA